MQYSTVYIEFPTLYGLLTQLYLQMIGICCLSQKVFNLMGSYYIVSINMSHNILACCNDYCSVMFSLNLFCFDFTASFSSSSACVSFLFMLET